MQDRSIYFDEECRVRILDLDKLNACKGLQDNSAAFASNMQQLQDSVSQYISTIDQQVERIETEKLKAVGLRNKVAAMHEERRLKHHRLQVVLKEKQQVLDRLLVEEQSLLRQRAEHDALLTQLMDASCNGTS